jgi:hypothetical protein
MGYKIREEYEEKGEVLLMGEDSKSLIEPLTHSMRDIRVIFTLLCYLIDRSHCRRYGT